SQQHMQNRWGIKRTNTSSGISISLPVSCQGHVYACGNRIYQFVQQVLAPSLEIMFDNDRLE
ncbi:unnamed protein product, partial [Nesidiocoris tenuis]